MIIKINDVELDFRMTDADFYEKYMENAEKMDPVMGIEATEAERSDYKKMANLIRKKCGAVKSFLDLLFGEGTGEQVCGKNNDFQICADAYITIVTEIEKQGAAVNKKWYPGQEIKRGARVRIRNEV